MKYELKQVLPWNKTHSTCTRWMKNAHKQTNKSMTRFNDFNVLGPQSHLMEKKKLTFQSMVTFNVERAQKPALLLLSYYFEPLFYSSSPYRVSTPPSIWRYPCCARSLPLFQNTRQKILSSRFSARFFLFFFLLCIRWVRPHGLEFFEFRPFVIIVRTSNDDDDNNNTYIHTQTHT